MLYLYKTMSVYNHTEKFVISTALYELKLVATSPKRDGLMQPYVRLMYNVMHLWARIFAPIILGPYYGVLDL